jgi:hypothetical protein
MWRIVPGLVLCSIARGALADDASQPQKLVVADRAARHHSMAAMRCLGIDFAAL